MDEKESEEANNRCRVGVRARHGGRTTGGGGRLPRAGSTSVTADPNVMNT
jgi:hypothetical protein